MPATDIQTLHRLPKNIYLEYIKLFPITRNPELRTYTTLIFTLLAVIGFSLFAISPTVQTILELRRTRDDNRFANQSLETKIAAMQSLQSEYGTLGSSLTRIAAAIPTSPEIPTLLAKAQTLAGESGMSVSNIEVMQVELTKPGVRIAAKPSSFVFSLTLTGTYAQLTQFLASLHHFDRIVTVDSLAISKDDQPTGMLAATIKARAYFHPEAEAPKGAATP